MKTPLDFHLADRTGAVKAARIYSNLVSPPTIFAALGLAIAFRIFAPDLITGFWWASLYGILVSLMPILFVLYLLRTGRVAELHMSNTNERHLPYIVAILFAILAWGVLYLLQGPVELRCLSLFNVVELTLLALINTFWLISLHSTGIMAAWVIVGLVFGWATSLIVLPFVFSVCWVRLFLKRHTPAQIGAGLLLGFLSAYSLTWVGCFV